MSFDPNAFLNASFTEANSTETIPIPESEYPALSEKIDLRPWQSTDGTKSGISLDVTWELDSPEVKQLLGRDKVTARQQIMLDLTESGTIDFGKGRNVTLGRLREALDLNKPGMPFRFDMIVGRAAKVLIKHRLDKNNPDTIYSEVRAVTKL